jgi:hypothetical protein
MAPPGEPDDAHASTQPGARSPSDVRMGPAACDALLRAIAQRVGAEKLRAIGITVPDERQIGGELNLLSERIDEENLTEGLAFAVSAIRSRQGAAPITWIGKDEAVALVSASHATGWLTEMARLDRGLKELAVLATEGRSEVALVELARLLTQR